MTTSPTLREMVAKLISIPSVSSAQAQHDMGNRPVIDCLANWLNDIGFQIDIVPCAPSPHAKDKANLIANIGEGDEGLVLAGHTDTVNYDPTGWDTDPFKAVEKDGNIYGLGSADMKSFLAIAIEAAREFTAADLKQSLTIVATADEESTMQGARALAAQGNRPGRYCVIGEPTDLTPIRQHKGVFMETITLHGQAGHSSNPRLGNNALDGMYEVMKALRKFRRELADKHINHDFIVPIPTLNFGHIHGGDGANQICAKCELHIDVRLLPDMELQPLRDALRRCVGKVAEARGLRCELKALFQGIPAFATPEDSAIVALAEEYTGRSAQAVAFGTEAPFFNAMGMETVILGPGSIDQAHQPNECISLSAFKPTIEVLRKMIHAVCVQGATTS